MKVESGHVVSLRVTPNFREVDLLFYPLEITPRVGQIDQIDQILMDYLDATLP